MKITCVSAANIESARKNSASVRTCELVRDLVLESDPLAQVEIVPLIDYRLKPCKMCGKCFRSERCSHDRDFNRVFEKLIAADAVFLVVPHYAPLPSKLMMLLEKMEEIAFLNGCASPDYRFPLRQKPAGVIGHGGQPVTEDTMNYYQRMLVEPVAMALGSVSMRVIGADAPHPYGATFGILSIDQRPGEIFVEIRHDWADVRRRIAPLVRNVAAAAAGS